MCPLSLNWKPMRPNTFDVDLDDVSLTRFLSNATGATWTLSQTTPGDGLAHQISIRNDAAVDHSAKTAILVGTDQNGVAQTETVNLPGSTLTIESTGYYLTLTSVTPSTTIGADTMDIGFVDEAATKTYPLDWCSPYAANVSVDVTGTINFTVQQTFNNVLAGETPVWVDITALASKTADTTSTAAVGATAIRLLVNSYSSGAELQMYTSQANRNT